MVRLKLFIPGCLVILLVVTLMPFQNAKALERVVILNPAVSPILHQLSVDSMIVGITFNDETFKNKVQVGSHLSPNIELIKALKPDLLVVGSKRAFSDELAARFKAELYRYDPRDLNEILDNVAQLGHLFGKVAEAQAIIDRETSRLALLKPLPKSVSVVYEISQRPLKVAGQQNIVTSIIKAAGGTNLIAINKKHVLISAEKVLEMNPQFYLYQNGPMNKNPQRPEERNYFLTLKSRVLEVDQLTFSRPGLNVFDAVVELNNRFAELSAVDPN